MKIRKTLLIILATLGLAAATVSIAAAAVPPPTQGTLKKYDITSSYVSGVSAGGFMANQMHVAHSGVFKGSGIYTAGAYGCADSDDTYATIAQNACMKTSMTRKTPAQLEQMTRDRAAAGTVDPVANLNGDPVWLMHGSADNTVARAVNDDLATYYRDFGANVAYNTSTNAGHGWVSPKGSVACSSTASPYVNNCGGDQQREMLTHLFGSVSPPATSLNGKLIQFDQNTYAPGGNAAAISMGKDGFAYVPQACETGPCKLMVTLHGCYQYHGMVGDKLMAQANLNEYADTNNMIVLYPQATASYSLSLYNPRGCFNWWGYGGDAQYAQKGGKQITAMMKMVAALGGTAGGVDPTPTPTPTPTSTPECVTASNYTHTISGRAYAVWGQTYALGSNQPLGLWSTTTQTSLKKTATNYWVKC